MPPIPVEPQPFLFIETDSFGFKEETLLFFGNGFRSTADHPLCIDDTMPWDLCSFWECVKSVAHLACMTRHSGQGSDLSVSGDPPFGDALYDSVYPSIDSGVLHY